jgi:hypothetical protein
MHHKLGTIFHVRQNIANHNYEYIEQEIQSLAYTDNTPTQISHIKLILCM